MAVPPDVGNTQPCTLSRSANTHERPVVKIANYLVTGIATMAIGAGVALAATPTPTPEMVPVCYTQPATSSASPSASSVAGTHHFWNPCAYESSSAAPSVAPSVALSVAPSESPAETVSASGQPPASVGIVVQPISTSHAATSTLPVTGTNLIGLLAAGAMLVIGGSGAMLFARRRRVTYRAE